MKLNYWKTILVGLAFLTISLFWGFYEAVIPKILYDSFGLSNFWSGVVMTFDNVLALFLLPLFGLWSDKLKSRYGRRTPFIVIGIVLASIFMIGIAMADFYQQVSVIGAGIGPIVAVVTNGAIVGYRFDGSLEVFLTKETATYARIDLIWQSVTSSNPLYLIGFIVVLFIVLMSMSFYRTPAVSLMPDVTPKPLRSEANAIINLMGAVGGIIAIAIISLLTREFDHYIMSFLAVALILVVILVLFLFTVREVTWVKENHEQSVALGYETKEEQQAALSGEEKPMAKDVQRSFILILLSVFLWFFGFNAVSSKLSVYASTVLEVANYSVPILVGNLAALIGFVPLGLISKFFGRKNTILGGIAALAAAMLFASFLNATTSFLVYPMMAVAGLGWAAINVNSYPMVVEMSSGANVGKYTGYYYTASMAAQIFTPILSGALMDLLPWRLQVLFPYAFVFTALAFLTMAFVRHGDSQPVKK